MRYPTDEKGFKEYFKKRLLRNDAKAKRLYNAGRAMSGYYPGDYEMDNLDDALRESCGGLMNFVNSEKAEEINDEMYCDVLSALTFVCRKAKITISF